MSKSPHYKAYSAITFCKNTTEKDLYDLFGDSVGVMDERGNEIKDYFKHKYNKRNGWNN
tara:strand:- start:413 stop:589 length:177 start_codon:yes stop_codon:yes gene_type:complete